MLVKFLAVLAAAYVILVTILWGAQERMVLPGPSRALPDPNSLGLEGERVTVHAEDGTDLHGWYLPPSDAENPAPAIIWFYGNMETVGVLADVFRFFKPATYGLLALDYRGYGENAGQATESAIERDGEAAMEFIRSRQEIDPERITVYGRSIGSTVAMHLATKYPVAGVILDSPMSSAQDVASEHYWFFPRFLVKLELDNLGRAARLGSPLLVIHGEDDRIIPPWMGRAVADAAPDGRFISIPGAGHNTTYAVDPERYRDILWAHLGVDR